MLKGPIPTNIVRAPHQTTAQKTTRVLLIISIVLVSLLTFATFRSNCFGLTMNQDAMKADHGLGMVKNDVSDIEETENFVRLAKRQNDETEETTTSTRRPRTTTSETTVEEETTTSTRRPRTTTTEEETTSTTEDETTTSTRRPRTTTTTEESTTEETSETSTSTRSSTTTTSEEEETTSSRRSRTSTSEEETTTASPDVEETTSGVESTVVETSVELVTEIVTETVLTSETGNVETSDSTEELETTTSTSTETSSVVESFTTLEEEVLPGTTSAESTTETGAPIEEFFSSLVEPVVDFESSVWSAVESVVGDASSVWSSKETSAYESAIDYSSAAWSVYESVLDYESSSWSAKETPSAYESGWDYESSSWSAKETPSAYESGWSYESSSWSAKELSSAWGYEISSWSKSDYESSASWSAYETPSAYESAAWSYVESASSAWSNVEKPTAYETVADYTTKTRTAKTAQETVYETTTSSRRPAETEQAELEIYEDAPILIEAVYNPVDNSTLVKFNKPVFVVNGTKDSGYEFVNLEAPFNCELVFQTSLLKDSILAPADYQTDCQLSAVSASHFNMTILSVDGELIKPVYLALKHFAVISQGVTRSTSASGFVKITYEEDRTIFGVDGSDVTWTTSSPTSETTPAESDVVEEVVEDAPILVLATFDSSDNSTLIKFNKPVVIVSGSLEDGFELVDLEDSFDCEFVFQTDYFEKSLLARPNNASDCQLTRLTASHFRMVLSGDERVEIVQPTHLALKELAVISQGVARSGSGSGFVEVTSSKKIAVFEVEDESVTVVWE